MKINSIPSPVSHVIFPGTTNHVFNLEKHEAKLRKQENAEWRALKSQTKKLHRENQKEIQRNKAALNKTPFPGTVHSSFEPLTNPVSVTEKEVREAYALAQRAIAQGKIPPAAKQGRFFDVVI